MKLLTKELESIFRDSIIKIDETRGDQAILQFTRNSELGHLQCNSAMALAKHLKKPPREVAGLIINNLPENNFIQECEIAGPGFINIKLTAEAVLNYLKEVEGKSLFPEQDQDKTVIIDYSSPNIAKRMHIGHLRSTIIGDSIKRIYRGMGYNVIGDNHLGDWGTQFGKLIVSYNNNLNKENYQNSPIEELERLYVLFEKESAEKPELLDQAREELKKLQDGDDKNVALWKEFIDASLKEYDKVYSRLNVSFDTFRGESYYHPRMEGVLKELTDKKIAERSEGAMVVFFDEKEHLHPCLVQKKDGAYLYTTSDLACIKNRTEEYNVEQLIYVTDDRQIPHFKQVFRVADRLGWDVERHHIPFGVMKFTEGHFSSRKGNVIYLTHLLDEAEKRAFEIVSEKNPSLDEGEKKEIAKVVGLGAVKYFDLSQNRSSDIIFNWEKVLSFEGNTSPYLQYVYARIQSLIRKSELSEIVIEKLPSEISPLEQRIIHQLIQYPHVIKQAAISYKPNLISDYIYELSQSFNSFYSAHKILKEADDIKMFRLFLCERVAEVIKNGLDLLGIGVLDRM